MIPFFKIDKIKSRMSLSALRQLTTALSSGGVYTKTVPEEFLSESEKKKVGGFSIRKVYKLQRNDEDYNISQGAALVDYDNGYIEIYNKKKNILYKSIVKFDELGLVVEFSNHLYSKYYGNAEDENQEREDDLRKSINMAYWGYEELPRILNFQVEDKFYNFGFVGSGKLNKVRYETTNENVYDSITYKLFMFEVVQQYTVPQPETMRSTLRQTGRFELQKMIYGSADMSDYAGYTDRYWLPNIFKGKYFAKNMDVWFNFKESS